MEKERADSWSKIETENNNVVARKTVDYSTFGDGTTIPTRYHEGFFNNLSKEQYKKYKEKLKSSND